MIDLDVAIIGGGFSGCAVAAQLARHAADGFSVRIFEPGELGRGAAYGTRHTEHLLNTRAAAMSLFPDDPDHFVRWLGPGADPASFVSRRRYGDYVAEVAARALERPHFRLVNGRVRAVRAAKGGFVVESALGTRIEARAVVLATGNALPADHFLPPGVTQHPGYIGDPWRNDYRKVGGHVLLIGSGLTALDVLVALGASGHRGTAHIVSRHGRYPAVHADDAPYDVIPALDARDARALLRTLRRHVADAQARGFDWRSVIDAVRPESESLWRRLAPVERSRFERHLRTHWERRRHRAPQPVDAVRHAYSRSGRAITYAGRLTSMRDGDARIALNDGTTVALRPDWIVNCSGVGGVRAMARDPLIAGMLADGIVEAEPRGLGLRTTWELAALGASGSPVEGLWIVGPPVRGSRFEATAVPELRGMAATAAFEVLQAAKGQAKLA
ncbi:MAG TPA: FAD-dependent oxidoreductase [Candidatus Binatia bacterium]|nr:FAD-dependent oxidoreductase [Candidatus Binatia bacterium]